MSQLSLVLLVALGLVASGAATTRILVVKDIKEFVVKNPGVHLQPMEKQVVPAKAREAGSLTVRYNLGARLGGKLKKKKNK